MIQTEQLGLLHRWEFDFTFQKCVMRNGPTFTNGQMLENFGYRYLFGQKSFLRCVEEKGLCLSHCLWKSPGRPQNFQVKSPEDGFESVKLCALRVLRKMCPMNDGDMEVVVGRCGHFQHFTPAI